MPNQIMPKPVLRGVPFVAATDDAGGFASITVPIPSGLLADDIILVFLETTNGSSVSTPSGYAVLGTATDSSTTQIHVFWKRATGGESSFGMSNTDHLYAVTVLVRLCVKSGNPFEAVGTGNIASTASPAIPGVTTLGRRRLVIQGIARGNDVTGDQFSSPVNANLLNLSIVNERGSNQGNGGGVAAVAGAKPYEGASGSTTLTHADGAITYAYVSFAMKPIH